VVEAVCVVVVAAGVRIEVVGAVAIEGWVVGLGRAVGAYRMVAWVVDSGMC
jgi:hypothetical protein